MLATITISGADKAGALARIVSFFGRKGYGLRGHQILDATSGSKLLVIKLDVPRANSGELANDVKHVDPAFNAVEIAFEGTEDRTESTPKTSQSEVIKEMARRFPDVVDLVKAYGRTFTPEDRDRELFDAGRKIGGFHYQKEWSFGTPLKMPQALRRALVPALESFGTVLATDTNVGLPDSPFCAPGDHTGCCCEFLTGFIQGFLDAGPLTKNTRVKKAACRAKGGETPCAFTVAYEA